MRAMAVVDDAPGYILVVAGPGRGNNQSDVAAIDLSLGCGCAADLYPGAIGRRACNGHQDVARRRGVDRHGIFDPCATTAAALQDKILLQHVVSTQSACGRYIVVTVLACLCKISTRSPELPV